MKRKALIVGALPSPFEGPWVVLSDADTWRIVMGDDYGDAIRIEVEGGYEADGVVSGDRVRACIAHDIPGVPHVSVTAEAISGRPTD